MWKIVTQWHFQLHANSEQRFCTKCILDNFDEAVLRRRDPNFYIAEKQRQNLKAIHSKMCESTCFGGGIPYLSLVLRKMGFREV